MTTLATAQMEVAGAAQRLRLARKVLEDFLLEHTGKVCDADLARSLDHERESLECEVDAADRRYRECLLQYQGL